MPNNWIDLGERYKQTRGGKYFEKHTIKNQGSLKKLYEINIGRKQMMLWDPSPNMEKMQMEP